ncbi:hypothetical protein J6590_090192 [Homalodisca vitripennis]|nr:hypothetical protein J6590_090192 [Homalodisca vitripennis]
MPKSSSSLTASVATFGNIGGCIERYTPLWRITVAVFGYPLVLKAVLIQEMTKWHPLDSMAGVYLTLSSNLTLLIYSVDYPSQWHLYRKRSLPPTIPILNILSIHSDKITNFNYTPSQDILLSYDRNAMHHSSILRDYSDTKSILITPHHKIYFSLMIEMLCITAPFFDSSLRPHLVYSKSIFITPHHKIYFSLMIEMLCITAPFFVTTRTRQGFFTEATSRLQRRALSVDLHLFCHLVSTVHRDTSQHSSYNNLPVHPDLNEGLNISSREKCDLGFLRRQTQDVLSHPGQYSQNDSAKKILAGLPREASFNHLDLRDLKDPVERNFSTGPVSALPLRSSCHDLHPERVDSSRMPILVEYSQEVSNDADKALQVGLPSGVEHVSQVQCTKYVFLPLDKCQSC